MPERVRNRFETSNSKSQKKVKKIGNGTKFYLGFYESELEDENLLQLACKKLCRMKPKKQKLKRNFINRMEFDIEKREKREKTYDELKKTFNLQLDGCGSMTDIHSRYGSPRSQRFTRFPSHSPSKGSP